MAFLDASLPTTSIPQYKPLKNRSFKAGHTFNKILTAENEFGMYDPFIKSMKKFAPRLHFVDTHAQPDKRNGFPFDIKPDISIYHGSHSVEGCDLSLLDMHVEFKTKNDPFASPHDNDEENEGKDNPSTPASSSAWSSPIHSDFDADDTFVGPSPNSKDARIPSIGVDKPFVIPFSDTTELLGQIGAYTAAQLGLQFRTHCFSVIIFKDVARILRWDREGAVVTGPISYNADQGLAEFFSRFSQAPPELRGVDTTVSFASEDEAIRARTKLGLSSDTTMFKTTIPRSGDSLPFPIIFPRLDFVPTTPAGRATRTCVAYDLSGDRKVFFKDSWRVDAEDVAPEGKIYALLNEQGVRNVPTCLASGDVVCQPEQLTMTVVLSRLDWVFRSELVLTAHRHHRIVLNIVGESLAKFTSSRELVQNVHDALIAHQDAFRAGVLHRDISPGNIIVFLGTGYLIDWDLAKEIRLGSPRRAVRTGTWQFMSTALVADPAAEHTFVDDLESAFWALLWTLLMHSESSFSIETLSKFIRETFESSGSQGKENVLVSQGIFSKPSQIPQRLFSNDANPPSQDLQVPFPSRQSLNMLLKDLANLFRHRYTKLDDHHWLAFKVALHGRQIDSLGVDTIRNCLTPAAVQEIRAKFGNEDGLEHFEVYRCGLMMGRLSSHDYIINRFSHYLELKDWPSDDKAEPQHLIAVNTWGRDVPSRVSFRPKHLLEDVGEGKSRKKSRSRPTKSGSRNDRGRNRSQRKRVGSSTST